jgi:hypothetical protein
MTYDSESYELAVYFLESEPFNTQENRHLLAQLIQKTVEDFVDDAREKYDDQQSKRTD